MMKFFRKSSHQLRGITLICSKLSFTQKTPAEDIYSLLFWMSIAYQAYPKKGSGRYLICKPKGDDVFAYIDQDFEKARQKAKEILLTIKGVLTNWRFSIAAAFPRWSIHVLDLSFSLHEINFILKIRKILTKSEDFIVIFSACFIINPFLLSYSENIFIFNLT